MMDTKAAYLQDLGRLLRDIALKARKEARNKSNDVGSVDLFAEGRAMAFYEVISLMQQQADAFGLHYEELGLAGLDADRDLL